jgi:hypothetical protein
MSIEEENLLLDLDSENEDIPSNSINVSSFLRFEDSHDTHNMKNKHDFTQKLRDSNQMLKKRVVETSTSRSFKLPKRPGSPSIYTEPKTKLRIQDKVFAGDEFLQLIHHRIIPLSKLKDTIKEGEINGDFVIIGVVHDKTGVKTSANGSKYIMLKITDLKTKMNVFLFNNALATFAEEPVSTVVALLNPVSQSLI